jgi:hypothetical protein
MASEDCSAPRTPPTSVEPSQAHDGTVKVCRELPTPRKGKKEINRMTILVRQAVNALKLQRIH